MYKKDYELISKSFLKVKPYDNNTIKSESINKEALAVYYDCIDSLSEELKKDNPKFNVFKFKRACGIIQPIL